MSTKKVDGMLYLTYKTRIFTEFDKKYIVLALNEFLLLLEKIFRLSRTSLYLSNIMNLVVANIHVSIDDTLKFGFWETRNTIFKPKCHLCRLFQL